MIGTGTGIGNNPASKFTKGHAGYFICLTINVISSWKADIATDNFDGLLACQPVDGVCRQPPGPTCVSKLSEWLTI